MNGHRAPKAHAPQRQPQSGPGSDTSQATTALPASHRTTSKKTQLSDQSPGDRGTNMNSPIPQTTSPKAQITPPDPPPPSPRPTDLPANAPPTASMKPSRTKVEVSASAVSSGALGPSNSSTGRAATRESAAQRIQGLSTLLRVVGASVLLVAASVFLFQQWDAGNDLMRYASLGGMTLLLTVAGFLCGSKIGESKSARTLLGLVLAVLPIHFAVLGGFIYSQISWDGLPISVPAFASWTAASPGSALLLAGGALAALVPIAYLSFLTLARGSAVRLSALYMAMNVALLVPLRTPNLIALLTAGLAAAMIWFELKKVPSEPSLRTLEGRFCRVLMPLPLAIMVGRCIMYEPSVSLAGVLILAMAYTMHRLADRLTRSEPTRLAARLSAVAAACVGWFAVVGGLLPGLDLPEQALVPLIMWPCSLVMLLASKSGGVEARILRTAALVLVALVTGANLAIFPGGFTAFAALVAGIATLAYGYWSGSILLSSLAILISGFALWHEMRLAVELFGVGRWGALALLGTGIILIAAVLERHGDRLRTFLERMKRPIAAEETFEDLVEEAA